MKATPRAAPAAIFSLVVQSSGVRPGPRFPVLPIQPSASLLITHLPLHFLDIHSTGKKIKQKAKCCSRKEHTAKIVLVFFFFYYY